MTGLDPGRLGAAVAVLVAYAALLGATAWRVRRRPHDDRGPGEGAVLVVHASQTGTALGLAHATADAVRGTGRATSVHSLGDLALDDLRRHREALFVLATCGEGDAPDEALPFLRRAMSEAPGAEVALRDLRVGILSLGDRRFDQFCGFGRQVEAWLQAHGARGLFDAVEVDALAPADLARWSERLRQYTGSSTPVPAAFDRIEAPTQPWRLLARRELNPGSLGDPVYHLEFAPEPQGPLPAWEAGDLARVAVPGDARPRDYSIASVPGDGRLQLVVRRLVRPDGTPGLASGWLAAAPLGSSVPVQLIAHPGFRLGDNRGRPLILVGNGTGIAGLRSHLRARQDQAGARHWLLFGERQRALDFHFRDEIEAWQAAGVLARVDLAFSRDGEARAYVQQRLAENAASLRAWVDQGAAIYVCGDREGMALGVDEVLREVLGHDAVEELARTGRYRRDVY